MRVWVSPRKRTQQTFQLLFGTASGSSSDVNIDADRVTLTEEIAEWGYGDYEGLQVTEIRAQRRTKGLDQEKEWNIWRDGCDGGEYMPLWNSISLGIWLMFFCRSAEQVTERLDRLISKIRDIQCRHMNGEKPADVVLV